MSATCDYTFMCVVCLLDLIFLCMFAFFLFIFGQAAFCQLWIFIFVRLFVYVSVDCYTNSVAVLTI